MNTPANLQTPVTDLFATMRTLKRMHVARFKLMVEGDGLVVTPASGLSKPQRAYLHEHKGALVKLLSDAEILHRALVEAGPAGLAWREGTPPDWSDERLLAAGEVLYDDGRMINRNARRYAGQGAPRTEPEVGTTPSEPADQPATAVADAPSPGLDIDPFAVRVNELMAEGWARWNAEARARTEMRL